MAKEPVDLEEHDMTPSEAGMMPCILGDLDNHTADAPSTDLEQRAAPAAETPKTNPSVRPLERSTVTNDPSDLSISAPPNVIALIPPGIRSKPKIRPSRPPPIMGRALPPPATAVTPVDDPLRALQSYIGTRPANVDDRFHRKMLARDIRLEPQLYRWLVFGLSPGSVVPNSPLSGEEDDNSEDHQSGQRY